jgi:hypothetical protein
MPKQSGLGDALLIGGNLISGDVSAVGKVSGGPTAGLFTGIDKSAIERQGMLRDGGIDFTAFYNDTAVTGANAILKALPLTDTLVTYCRGTLIGSWAASCVAKQLNYDPTRGADGSLTFAVSTVANAFGLEWGQQLTPGLRTDTTATNGTSLDYGAVSSLFGAQAYVHIGVVAGTSATVTIQDSADNVTFAAITGLATTAVVPGLPSFQRLVTANNATIRRYVRAITTGTFTSAPIQVTFCRNDIIGQVF